MAEQNNTPAAIAYLLGCAGFLPFAIGVWAVVHPQSFPIAPLAAQANLLLPLYAASILSFLGGIRWGRALAFENTSRAINDMALSVIPALWGWIAAFVGGPLGYAMFAIAFLVMGLWDNQMVKRKLAPKWYSDLRNILTVLVVIAMGFAAIATFI